MAQTLTTEDTLIVCGDFGFAFECDAAEKEERKILASLPYTICFVDGNHENFGVLSNYPVETWNGGKVHIIEKDHTGAPKIIHLMRGQIFTIEDKKISHDYKVDYIITRTAPEDTMNLFYPRHVDEQPLNSFWNGLEKT